MISLFSLRSRPFHLRRACASILLAWSLCFIAQGAEVYSFWLSETISGTLSGPFISQPGSRISLGGSEWIILAARPGQILFSDAQSQKTYGPYDLVLQRIIDLGDKAYSFAKIQPLSSAQTATAPATPSPSASSANTTSTLERPKRWTPNPLPSTNPADHVQKPRAFSLEAVTRPSSVFVWLEPSREVQYDWDIGPYTGNEGTSIEMKRLGLGANWKNFFGEIGFISDAQSASTLVPNGTLLSDLSLSDGSGLSLKGGYRYAFVIDGKWHGHLGASFAYEKKDFDLHATLFTRHGAPTPEPGVEVNPDDPKTTASYTFESFQESTSMDELAFAVAGGIDYTTWYWGVQLILAINLYSDSDFSGSITVQNQTYNLSADPTHPIIAEVSGWYAPMDEFFLLGGLSIGTETTFRVGIGSFF